MVLSVRLAFRQSAQKTAKRDAELQQDIAEIEARLRQLESDPRPEPVPTRREWLSGTAAAAATA